MRLSANPASPHYVAQLQQVAQVFLQGQPVKWAMYADEGKGRVIVPLMDANGMVRHKDGEIMTQVLKGHVSIRPKPAAQRYN